MPTVSSNHKPGSMLKIGSTDWNELQPSGKKKIITLVYALAWRVLFARTKVLQEKKMAMINELNINDKAFKDEIELK